MLPDTCPVWRVKLDPELAEELRRTVESNQRAAVEEQGWDEPVPVDARVLRVEADLPVAVLVERTWPAADYGYRLAQIWRRLRGVEPEPLPEGCDGLVLLSHVAYGLREAGALGDELTAVEVEYAAREARGLGRESGGSG